MNLYPSIFRRKSCRKYNMTPLPDTALAEIKDAISGFTPLFDDAPLSFRIVAEVKGLYVIEAPHYLIISGSGAPKEKENAGFLYQQLVLWLDAKELGSVWLGEAKDKGPDRSKNDIVVLAFGAVTEPVHREPHEFKRKSIEEITNSPEDACIKAAHLAPSGMNGQPWYFEKQGERVNLYRRKPKSPIELIYKQAEVDMGIALCHYYLACKDAGIPFAFTRDDSLPAKSGYTSFGVINKGDF